MFQPPGLAIYAPPPPPPPTEFIPTKLELVDARPNYNELHPRVARVPMELFYECHRTDFMVNKVLPEDIEVGDRVWAQGSWIDTMEPDIIIGMDENPRKGQIRFEAIIGMGSHESAPMFYTVPTDQHMWVIDWPMYRLMKFKDVEMRAASDFVGALTRGAYVYNGLCWYAYLSPFQRRKVFSSGLFDTMIRNTIKMSIPRAQ